MTVLPSPIRIIFLKGSSCSSDLPQGFEDFPAAAGGADDVAAVNDVIPAPDPVGVVVALPFVVVAVASGLVVAAAASAWLVNATSSTIGSSNNNNSEGRALVSRKVSLATCCCRWQTPSSGCRPSATARLFFLRLAALCQHLIVVFAFATATKEKRGIEIMWISPRQRQLKKVILIILPATQNPADGVNKVHSYCKVY